MKYSCFLSENEFILIVVLTKNDLWIHVPDKRNAIDITQVKLR